MPQLETDAKPRAVTGARVKAVSRVSGSADALALTRVPGPATVKKGGKKRSTSSTVAEQLLQRIESHHRRLGQSAHDEADQRASDLVVREPRLICRLRRQTAPEHVVRPTANPSPHVYRRLDVSPYPNQTRALSLYAQMCRKDRTAST